MKWTKAPKVERPEFPKLIAVSGTPEEATKLLSKLTEHDTEASILDGGSRGTYLKVHNAAAEAAANAEVRTFPLQ